jgi:hypothetical protein
VTRKSEGLTEDRGSIPDRCTYLSLLQSVQIGSKFYAAPYSVRSKGLFVRWQSGRSLKLISHLHLEQKLIKDVMPEQNDAYVFQITIRFLKEIIISNVRAVSNNRVCTVRIDQGVG